MATGTVPVDLYRELIEMSQESFGDEKQAQDGDDQRQYGGEPVEQSDEEQAQREEEEYGDSSAAVSSDTQFADPRKGSDGASFGGDSASGRSSQGASTVFGEPDQAGTSASAGEQAGNAHNDDQDAEPPTSGYGEQPEVVSSDDAGAETSYGEDQDAAPTQPPYEQP